MTNLSLGYLVWCGAPRFLMNRIWRVLWWFVWHIHTNLRCLAFTLTDRRKVESRAVFCLGRIHNILQQCVLVLPQITNHSSATDDGPSTNSLTARRSIYGQSDGQSCEGLMIHILSADTMKHIQWYIYLISRLAEKGAWEDVLQVLEERQARSRRKKKTWNFSFLWTHDMVGLRDKLQGLINTCRLAKRGEELPLEEQLWTPLHRFQLFCETKSKFSGKFCSNCVANMQ